MIALAPEGSADRDDPRIPPTCPLPRAELVAYLDEAADPDARACTDCAHARSLTVVSGRSIVAFTSCNEPNGSPRLVAAERRTTALREDVDRRVAAALRAGERDVERIAAMTGTSTDGVWRSLARLRDDGAVPPRLRLRGR